MNLTEKQVELLRALLDGKTVQSKTYRGVWQDCLTLGHAFTAIDDWPEEMRVKPEDNQE